MWLPSAMVVVQRVPWSCRSWIVWINFRDDLKYPNDTLVYVHWSQCLRCMYIFCKLRRSK